MMEKSRARCTRMVHAFRGKRIGVLGDFMLDELLRGEATRISPEAPVPVVLVDGANATESYPGGAGNVAANIAALGAQAIPWGVIGGDESGRRLRRLLQRHGIRCETLVKENNRLTPRKVRIVAHQHQLLRLDFERASEISSHSAAQLLRSFRREAKSLDALIVSDYQKGAVSEDLCGQLLPIARREGVPVFVDPKPSHPGICRYATVVTPNLREAEQMAGMPLREPRQLEVGGRRLLEKFHCNYLLITRSGEGMTLFSSRGVAHSIPGILRPVYDVTGAGDTVIAVLTLAYCSGATIKEAAELANQAAGKVVLKFGTSQLSSRELLEAARDSP